MEKCHQHIGDNPYRRLSVEQLAIVDLPFQAAPNSSTMLISQPHIGTPQREFRLFKPGLWQSQGFGVSCNVHTSTVDHAPPSFLTEGLQMTQHRVASHHWSANQITSHASRRLAREGFLVTCFRKEGWYLAHHLPAAMILWTCSKDISLVPASTHMFSALVQRSAVLGLLRVALNHATVKARLF